MSTNCEPFMSEEKWAQYREEVQARQNHPCRKCQKTKASYDGEFPGFCAPCQSAEAAASAALFSARIVTQTTAGLPPRYRWASFESPELAARVRPPKAIQRALAASQAASTVVLLGGAGSGKTSLACAVLRALAAQFKIVGSFASCFGLAKARQEHPLGQGDAPAVSDAARAKLLLLDELGAELSRNTAVAEVIHERHAQERQTIYTSGFTEQQLCDRYGDGIARRVFEGAVVIKLGGA